METAKYMILAQCRISNEVAKKEDPTKNRYRKPSVEITQIWTNPITDSDWKAQTNKQIYTDE